ncbi:hypothetical protein SCOR_20165 [Sulfidibacter corallicola]
MGPTRIGFEADLGNRLWGCKLGGSGEPVATPRRGESAIKKRPEGAAGDKKPVMQGGGRFAEESFAPAERCRRQTDAAYVGGCWVGPRQKKSNGRKSRAHGRRHGRKVGHSGEKRGPDQNCGSVGSMPRCGTCRRDITRNHATIVRSCTDLSKMNEKRGDGPIDAISIACGGSRRFSAQEQVHQMFGGVVR